MLAALEKLATFDLHKEKKLVAGELVVWQRRQDEESEQVMISVMMEVLKMTFER